MFSKNNIRDLAHSTTVLIDLTLGKHFQILGERRGGMQKWHLQMRYKTLENQRFIWNKAA